MKIFKKLFYLFILLIVVAVGILAVYAYSPDARKWSLIKATNIVATKTDYSIDIQGVVSHNVGEWGFERIEVYKKARPVIKTSNLVVRFSVLKLLNKNIKINKLSAAKIDIYSIEKSKEPTDDAKPKKFAFPKLVPISVDELNIDELSLHPDKLKNKYKLRGKLAFMGGDTPLYIDMDVKTKGTTALSASLKTKIADENSATILANVNEEKGGLISQKLNLPIDKQLQIKLQTDIKKSDDKYKISLREFSVPLGKSDVKANGSVDINTESQVIAIDSLVLDIDENKHIIKGSVSNDNIDIQTKIDKFSLSVLQPWLNKPEIKGSVSGDVSLRGDVNNPSIATNLVFAGKYEKVPLKINVDAKTNRDELTINNLKVQTNEKEHLTVKGNYTAKQIDIQVNAKAFPTKIISAMGVNIKPGDIASNLNIKGTKESPLINGNIKFTSDFTYGSQNVPITFSSDIKTAEQIVQAKVEVIKNKEVISKANVKIPINTYLNLKDIKKGVPLDTKLSADFDMAYIQMLLDNEVHEIKGLVKLDLDMGGTWHNPILNGYINLNKGYYENKTSGTVLKDMDIKLKAENTRLTLLNADASDGVEGKISLSGIVDWSDKLQNPIKFELKADNAKLLRRRDMEGVTSGNLKLEGTFKKLLLSGELDVTPFTLFLDNMVTNNISELKVTEESDENDGTNSQKSILQKLPIINMDVVLLAKNQAFLRGKGVNAELEGKINVEGTLTKPEYSGQFKTVRGSYTILGKKFILQDGSVRFEGSSFTLLIPGTYKGKDIDVTAQLSGSLDDLSLNLSSAPSMPQDEIVSNLLFGKSSRSITPLQAIRLANEVNKLKNGGRDIFNPLEETRKLIGVDNISVESQQTDKGQDISVGVGKYVTEKVYIEVEKGNDPSQSIKGSVEVEVSPNLSVESSTGGRSGLGGIELKWKHDY